MLNKTHIGDCRKLLADFAAAGIRAQTCVTSPPYFGLRDYGHPDQIGLEPTPDEYVAKLVEVFREVRRVLRDDGTLWLNLGDSYARTGGTDRKVSATAKVGSTRNTLIQMSDRTSRATTYGLKDKDLIGIPWRVAFALQADGWYLRQDVIWHKPNPMPESVRDRFTKAHEYIFLLSKSPRYYFDHEAIKEPSVYADCGRPSKRKGEFKAKGEPLPGQLPFRAITETRNRRSVWTVPTRPYKGAHFATFPRALIEPCILAGSRPGDVVLDPFMGSGTTAQVATDLGRQFIGCEINPKYVELHELRRTTIGMAI